MSRWSGVGLAGLAFAAGPGLASAATSTYEANLSELNDSGASAHVNLTLDDVAQTLEVQYDATGLEANMPHPGHIHGLFEGGPIPPGGDPVNPGPAADSTSPTLANDDAGDDDGFIEVAEGLTSYGNILLPLTTSPGLAPGAASSFPVADAEGNINYDVTFDLTDDSLFVDPISTQLQLDSGDLFPLTFREVVLHGLTLNEGDGAESDLLIDEADGTAGFKGVLPVASGEIFVPSPSAAVAGVVLLGGLAVRRRRRSA